MRTLPLCLFVAAPLAAQDPPAVFDELVITRPGESPADHGPTMPVHEITGYLHLLARLGAAAPSGAGVVWSHISCCFLFGYWPQFGHPEVNNKNYVIESGNSASWDRVTRIASYQYGNFTGIAPGVIDVHLWDAFDFLSRVTGPTDGWVGHIDQCPPDALDLPHDLGEQKVLAMSHLAGVARSACDQFGWTVNLMRRVDYGTKKYDLVIAGACAYTPDPVEYLPLYGGCFNTIGVGEPYLVPPRSYVDVPAPIDGAGRMKPDLICTDDTNSDWGHSVALVAGGAALLVETARTHPGLSSDADAERAEVVKAVLLASTDHWAGWSNHPDPSGPARGVTFKPIDPELGTGHLNVDRAHEVLTGLEADGSAGAPGAGTVPTTAWDLATVDEGEPVYYRFVLPAATDLSVVATWFRQVPPDLASYVLPDHDLELWSVDAQTGQLISLVGDAGLGVFDVGNVVSRSSVDNVEHLYLQGLSPGEYVLELQRDVDGHGPWDVALAWCTSARETYCEASPNSSGFAATIDRGGSTSISANDLTLYAFPVPSQPGLFFFGPTQADAPLGNGTRCVGGNLRRLPVEFASSDWLTHAVDLGSAPANAIVAGSTWHFQAWFRDPPAGGAKSNLSAAMTLTFTP